MATSASLLHSPQATSPCLTRAVWCTSPPLTAASSPPSRPSGCPTTQSSGAGRTGGLGTHRGGEALHHVHHFFAVYFMFLLQEGLGACLDTDLLSWWPLPNLSFLCFPTAAPPLTAAPPGDGWLSGTSCCPSCRSCRSWGRLCTCS